MWHFPARGCVPFAHGSLEAAGEKAIGRSKSHAVSHATIRPGFVSFEAVQQRDYNLLLGILLLSSLLVIVVNLVIDLLYAVLDPRIELR